MNTSNNPLLLAALEYAASGWPVFPCNTGKTPRVSGGFQAATTDPDQINGWWANWPNASIGAPTGPGMGSTGVWVLDVDVPKKPGDPDGRETLAALEAKHGPLPPTVEQRTGGGGRHLFFRWPEGREVRNTAGARGKLGPGLDVRGAGGYVILPPSGHPSGGPYAWSGNGAALTDASSWLLDLVAPLPRQEAPKKPAPTSRPRVAGSSAYGRKALEEEAAKVAGAVQGGRNHALNQAAFVMGQLVAGGELDRGEAESALLAAAGQCGLPDGEARKTIESGFKAGEKEPRKAPGKVGVAEVSGVPLDEWEPSPRKKWPVLDHAALPGWGGDFVDLATANSEADPAAVLTTFLVRFACESGGPNPATRPHLYIGDSRHEPRLFAVVAGQSSKARKGTSAAPVNRLFTLSENSESSYNSPPMAATSPGPLSSGEGLIWNVRDEVKVWETEKKSGVGSWVVKDPGIDDKRLCVVDEELAAALSCTKREGNTLSATLRGFWDSGTVSPLTKTSPTKTTKAHVCIVAHITLEELNRALDEVELFNGFANRFLWTLARRQKLVSRPTPMPSRELDALRKVLADRLGFAHLAGRMEMSSAAYALWDDVYPTLSVERGGLFGAVVGRAEAQVQRLAMVYALLDGRSTIAPKHLEAALAYWRYCETSAAFIFEGRQADPVREKILAALRAASSPMTATDLHRVLGNNSTRESLKDSLEALTAAGLVRHEKEETKTKPRNLFSLNEKYEFYELSPTPESSPQKDNSYNSYNSPASEEKQDVFPTGTKLPAPLGVMQTRVARQSRVTL